MNIRVIGSSGQVGLVIATRLTELGYQTIVVIAVRKAL